MRFTLHLLSRGKKDLKPSSLSDLVYAYVGIFWLFFFSFSGFKKNPVHMKPQTKSVKRTSLYLSPNKRDKPRHLVFMSANKH